MQQNATWQHADVPDRVHPMRGTDPAHAATEMLLQLAARADIGPAARKLLDEAINLLHGEKNAALVLATRHRTFIEAMPDAITVHDEHGDIVDANAAACHLYGHSRSILLTLNLLDLCPVLPPDHLRQVIAVCQTSRDFTIETTIRRGDGRDFPVEVHSNVYSDGGETRVLSVARGISHWQHTALALRDAEQRYRTTLHSMDKSVIIHDHSGRMVYGNPAAYRMFRLGEADPGQLEREGFPGWRYADADGNAITREDLPYACAVRSGKAVESELISGRVPHVPSRRS